MPRPASRRSDSGTPRAAGQTAGVPTTSHRGLPPCTGVTHAEVYVSPLFHVGALRLVCVCRCSHRTINLTGQYTDATRVPLADVDTLIARARYVRVGEWSARPYPHPEFPTTTMTAPLRRVVVRLDPTERAGPADPI